MTDYSLEKQESNSVQSHINVAKELEVPDTDVSEPLETGIPELNNGSNTVETLELSSDEPFSVCAITLAATRSSMQGASVPNSRTNRNACFPLLTHLSSLSVCDRLYQENPRVLTSRIRSARSWWRNYTCSLESYERAARKEFILLMRNFMYTQKFPDFHTIIVFHNPMSIKEFSKIRNQAFAKLAKEGVRAFYVHEPSKKSWLHIHALTIFDGNKNSLRTLVKEVFMETGLEYGRDKDFHVNIKLVNPTFKDYWRLCCYILKFKGRRKHKRRIPLLFQKGLSIRKTGMIGKWFAKDKGKLWEEYRDECEQRRMEWGKHDVPVVPPSQELYRTPLRIVKTFENFRRVACVILS